MPQIPLNFSAKNTSGAMVPLLTNGSTVGGALIVGGAVSTKLGLTAASTTLLKAGSGRVGRVAVTTLGTGTGAVYDSATTAGIGAANLIAIIPEAVGVTDIDFPYHNGLVVVTGAAMVASVSFD